MVLDDLKARGATELVVTEDAPRAASLDRAAVVSGGGIEETGPTRFSERRLRSPMSWHSP